jgi:hypothetical protein
LDKRNILNKVLEQQNTYLIHKTDHAQNRFCELFFSCVISNESIDIYDFFSEMKVPYIRKDTNKHEINLDVVKMTYKWLAMYYVVNFSSYIENKDIEAKIKENLYYVYDFNNEDKEMLEKFLKLYDECESLFQVDFIKNISKAILDNSNEDLMRYGLIFNVFYNSYNNFVNSYTRYIDIECWLKYA